jgi:hypothetical protein
MISEMLTLIPFSNNCSQNLYLKDLPIERVWEEITESSLSSREPRAKLIRKLMKKLNLQIQLLVLNAFITKLLKVVELLRSQSWRNVLKRLLSVTGLLPILLLLQKISLMSMSILHLVQKTMKRKSMSQLLMMMNGSQILISSLSFMIQQRLLNLHNIMENQLMELLLLLRERSLKNLLID